MKFQELRKQRLMSLRELALAIGSTPTTLHAIEQGRTPRISTIRKLSQALGVDPLEIEEFRAVIQAPAKESE